MGIGEAQWPLPDEDEGDHPSIEARRGIETRKAINACRVLLGKETEKETTFARTWRIETRKQRSLVALLMLDIGADFPLGPRGHLLSGTEGKRVATFVLVTTVGPEPCPARSTRVNLAVLRTVQLLPAFLT